MKTISAFLNSRGGNLIIGVTEDGSKNKIIGIITEWIQYLEEMKLKIMKMSDTAPKLDKPTFSHFGDDEEDREDS